MSVLPGRYGSSSGPAGFYSQRLAWDLRASKFCRLPSFVQHEIPCGGLSVNNANSRCKRTFFCDDIIQSLCSTFESEYIETPAIQSYRKHQPLDFVKQLESIKLKSEVRILKLRHVLDCGYPVVLVGTTDRAPRRHGKYREKYRGTP